MIRPKRTDTGTQTISLRFFLIPTVLAGIAFLAYFIYFQILQVPMTGKNSIAQMVIVLGELSGIATFAVAYIQNHRQIHGRIIGAGIGEFFQRCCCPLQLFLRL